MSTNKEEYVENSNVKEFIEDLKSTIEDYSNRLSLSEAIGCLQILQHDIIAEAHEQVRS